MSAVAARLVTAVSDAAARADAGGMQAVPAGFVPLADLTANWQYGETDTARERSARRWAESLAEGRDTFQYVLKIGRRWHVSPVAPLPWGKGQTVRAFLFIVRGNVAHELGGQSLHANIVERLLRSTKAQREMFYNRSELADGYTTHEHTFASLARPERDRLFRADPERQKWCYGKGITRWNARSVREWMAKVEKGIWPDERGRPRDDLAGSERFSPEAQAMFRTLYLTESRRSARYCWEQVKTEAEQRGWQVPSYAAVARWVKANLPASIANYHRLGAHRWAAKHAPFIERDRGAQYRPNEEWVCDHHRVDFWTKTPNGRKVVRLWLTAWQDMATGLIVAYWLSWGQPNSETILLSFRAAVIEYGAPLRVRFDNGKDFRAHVVAGGRPKRDREQIEGTLQRLGVEVRWCEIYHGQSKPVERWFGLFEDHVGRNVGSYCGNAPDTRPETLARRLREAPESVPTFDAIDAATAAYVALWNRTEHDISGRRIVPADAFAAGAIVKRTAPREVLDELLLPEKVCRVGRLGVKVCGHWFGQASTLLFRMQGQDVRVKYDPRELSRVRIYDMAGAFLFDAEDQRLRGVCKDDLREAKSRVKDAKRACQRAAAATHDRFVSETTLAKTIARENQAATQQAVARKAAGAENAPVPTRDVELLPGAAEAQRAVESRNRPRRSVAETVNLLGDYARTHPPVKPVAEQQQPDLVKILRAVAGEWGSEVKPVAETLAEMGAAALNGDDRGDDYGHPLDELDMPDFAERAKWQEPDPLDELDESEARPLSLADFAPGGLLEREGGAQA